MHSHGIRRPSQSQRRRHLALPQGNGHLKRRLQLFTGHAVAGLHHADLRRQLRTGHLRHADILHTPFHAGNDMRLFAALLRLANRLFPHDDERTQLPIQVFVAVIQPFQQSAVAHELHTPVGHFIRAGVNLWLRALVCLAHLVKARRTAQHLSPKAFGLRAKGAAGNLLGKRLHRSAQTAHVPREHSGKRNIRKRAHFLLCPRAEASHLSAVMQV